MKPARVPALSAADGRYRFTGWQMVAVTLVFFGVAVAANVSLAYFANSSWPGLVVSNSYIASQQFNEKLAEARRQNALGWALALDAGSDGLLLEARTAQGAKLGGLEVSAALRRPVSDSEDRMLRLSETEPGRYAVGQPLLSGTWEVELTATRGDGARMTRIFRVFVKAGTRP
jgi:nitrogen fixation protein FixH